MQNNYRNMFRSEKQRIPSVVFHTSLDPPWTPLEGSREGQGRASRAAESIMDTHTPRRVTRQNRAGQASSLDSHARPDHDTTLQNSVLERPRRADEDVQLHSSYDPYDEGGAGGAASYDGPGSLAISTLSASGPTTRARASMSQSYTLPYEQERLHDTQEFADGAAERGAPRGEREQFTFRPLAAGAADGGSSGIASVREAAVEATQWPCTHGNNNSINSNSEGATAPAGVVSQTQDRLCETLATATGLGQAGTQADGAMSASATAACSNNEDVRRAAHADGEDAAAGELQSGCN